jgi:hypothetical protein
MDVFDRLRMPSLGGATGWLNSEPLGPAELRGHVLVNFWTFTCIKLAPPGAVRPRLVAGLPRRRAARNRRAHARVLVRARDRSRAAGDEGARDRLPGRGRQRLRHLERLRQPRLAGALLRRHDGVIRDHHFGEGRYEQSERVIQRLLGIERELVSVEGLGVEAKADWDHLRTPETYLGYGRSERFAQALAPARYNDEVAAFAG